MKQLQIRVFGEQKAISPEDLPSQFIEYGLLSQPLLKRKLKYHGLLNFPLYTNRVKDGKGVLDTRIPLLYGPLRLPCTASRGLTVGADIDYVLVQPAGESRKFVVASELLNSLSEKFGWADVQSLGYLPWSGVNHIVNSPPMGYGCR